MLLSSLDKPLCNCGIVGVYGHPEAARLVYLCLYALQHRGQESAGIAASDFMRMRRHAGLGLVADVFSDASTLSALAGSLAIGHNRYSTTGSTQLANAQPIVVNAHDGPLAIAHNGNLVNSGSCRRRLVRDGAIFQTSTDTEVVLHLIARSKRATLVERLMEALGQVQGAYSLVLMNRTQLIAVRDPRGFRPLSLGCKDDAYVVASETCAMDLIGAEYLREVEPGEVLVSDRDGLHSLRLPEQAPRAACIFEFIYFSRPDSKIFDENVDKCRRKLGKTLALEHPADADIVIAVPDSSNTAAVGYSRRSGIKFELGLIRNHYIGRTFIHPEQDVRDFSVRVKFNPVRGVLEGRRVVIVEDSIVRGTTLKHLVGMVRAAGAKEVHVRVTSSPIISPCYYGMDFPTRDELIASSRTVEEIRQFIRADTLGYLSMEGMLASVPQERGGYCHACFDGNYPLPPERVSKFQHEQECWVPHQ
ncbi:MAG: amidophosphoribosyltransferase [bacterium]|nr:amidophosphoribosyltransferase [candidate division KSB1 bacterium]MDH7559600.1 amidophosphoribosyltransferase [bacterium]